MIAFADWRIEENAKNQFQQIESPRDSTDATSPFSPSQRPLRFRFDCRTKLRWLKFSLRRLFSAGRVRQSPGS
jgi:hypothetical protein